MSAESARPADICERLHTLSQRLGSAASAPLARPRADALPYAIEGEIGAGKTELAKALAIRLRARGFRVCLILEPVDQWREIGILGKFYKDPGRFGYSFQTYVYATRVLAIVEAVRAEPDADIYLLERSPATDHVFMELQRELVDPVEMRMYYTWCRAYELLLPIDLRKARAIYLKTSLNRCMTRLEQRKRDGEVVEETSQNGKVSHDGSATGGVSSEYQERLRRAHEQFLRQSAPTGEFPHLPECPFAEGSVISVGAELADKNFRDPGTEQTAVLDAIIKMMGLEA